MKWLTAVLKQVAFVRQFRILLKLRMTLLIPLPPLGIRSDRNAVLQATIAVRTLRSPCRTHRLMGALLPAPLKVPRLSDRLVVRVGRAVTTRDSLRVESRQWDRSTADSLPPAAAATATSNNVGRITHSRQIMPPNKKLHQTNGVKSLATGRFVLVSYPPLTCGLTYG